MSRQTKTPAQPLKIETPLVLPSGDTTPVSAALRFLAKSFLSAEPEEGMSLDYDECCGLSHLLNTCAAALSVVNNPDFTKGGDA